MIKRILCVMAAIMVASSSAMAWTAESFIGNDYDQQETYDFEPVSDVPMRFMSARTSSSDSSLYEVDLFNPDSTNFLIPDGSNDYVVLWGTKTMVIPPDTYIPGLPEVCGSLPADFSLAWAAQSNGWYWMGSRLRDLSYSIDSSYFSDFDFSYFIYSGFECVYDIPVPSDSYGVSFSPSILSGSRVYANGESNNLNCKISFLINDQVVVDADCSQNVSYSQETTFTYTEPIESITVKLIYNPIQSVLGLPTYNDSSDYDGVVTRCGRQSFIYQDSSLTVGFLDQFGGLNVHNDQAQSIINDHNGIESEWTGSMTSNFNALSIETFSFPSGLVSAFGLITGIFNDLWNGMGEYKIAYVFPLTLGIALLLIGRISKFAGGQSSGKRNRGDDGA